MPCVPLLYFPDLSQPALLSSEQKHGWRSTIQMQRTRESFPFSCAVTTKRSSRETAGSAKNQFCFETLSGTGSHTGIVNEAAGFAAVGHVSNGVTCGLLLARAPNRLGMLIQEEYLYMKVC